jgi:hypothetical protein
MFATMLSSISPITTDTRTISNAPGFAMTMVNHKDDFSYNLYEHHMNKYDLPLDCDIKYLFTPNVINVLRHNIRRFISNKEDWVLRAQQTLQSNTLRVHLEFKFGDKTYFTTPEIFRDRILPRIHSELISDICILSGDLAEITKWVTACLVVKAENATGFESCFNLLGY